MTKQSAKPQTKAAPQPEQSRTADAPPESEFPDALAILNRMTASNEGIEWDIRVYLVPGAMGRGQGGPANKQQYLFSVQFQDVPTLESDLAAAYPMGGVFRIYCRADGQLIKTVTLDIAPRPGYRPPKPDYVMAQQPEAGRAPDRLELLIERMMEQQARAAEENRALLRALVEQKAAPPVDPMAAFSQMADAFAKYQNLMPKNEANTGLEYFEKGMTFAEKLLERGGESGGEDISLLSVARDAIKSGQLGELFKAITPQMAPQAAPALAGPGPRTGQPGQGPAPARVPGPGRTPAPVAANGQGDQLAAAINWLCTQAAAGIQPDTLADDVLAALPENYLQLLEQQSDVVQFLAANFPQVERHRAWFESLVNAMWESDDQGANDALESQMGDNPADNQDGATAGA